MQRLFHITATDYDDFVSVLMAAKQTFLWAVDGVQQFHSMLHQIKRSVNVKGSFRARLDCLTKPSDVMHLTKILSMFFIF